MKTDKALYIKDDFQSCFSICEMLDSGRHYCQIIDSIKLCILVVDESGKILRYNFATKNFIGEENLKFARFQSIIPILGTLLTEEALSEVIQTGKSFHFEDIVYETEDGQNLVLDVKIYPCGDQEDNLECAIAILDDVTEQKATEKRIIKSEKKEPIDRLYANLAHELNNPLDGTLRYTRLLSNKIPADDPRSAYIMNIQEGLLRMSKMVKGLLDFARKSKPVSDPMDIPKSIEQIFSFLEEQITEQRIEIKTDFDENIPVVLNADIEQIFMNIIKNAVQAMPNGGKLSVSAKMLSPRLLEVKINDTGPGISKDMQDKIFEPFFTTKDFGQGVGLGLFICQQIAKSYNGSIGIESCLGKGTTFTVRLPLSKDWHSAGVVQLK